MFLGKKSAWEWFWTFEYQVVRVYVVRYNSVSFTSMKLWASLQMCGLSSMGGLPLVGNLKRGSCLIEGGA